MTHPPGTIIVPNTGHLRHLQFVADLFAVHKPEGTHVAFPSSGNVVQNLNRALKELVGDWAWLQADDHAFEVGLLRQLLSREVDVIVPLVVKRSRADQLLIGSETTTTDEDTGRVYPAYNSMALADVPDELFTVDIAGTGGMVVQRRVFDEIGYPYFESTDGLYLNEDITFCQRVRAAGFDIHVDPKARMGHIMPMTCWPY